MFTDRKGFDPDAFAVNSSPFCAHEHQKGLLLDIAAVARVGEGGIEIERAPEGIRFEPLCEHELLGTLADADDKFLRVQPRLLATRSSRPEKRRARGAALRQGSERGRGRLALLAPADRRRLR